MTPPKGYFWDAQREKWRVCLGHKTVGRFGSLKDAKAAAEKAFAKRDEERKRRNASTVLDLPRLL